MANGLVQLTHKERMILLILLNESRPIPIHRLTQMTMMNTQQTLKYLRRLSERLRIITTINHEIELALSEDSDHKSGKSITKQQDLF